MKEPTVVETGKSKIKALINLIHPLDFYETLTLTQYVLKLQANHCFK